MLYRSYISKINTIIKDNDINTSLNPVSELVFGQNVTRALVYFDHSKIKELMENGSMPDKTKIRHRLKLTNAGSLDFTMLHHTEPSSISGCLKKRASSFDLIFFLIPKEWDEGKGFDYSRAIFNEDYYGTKTEGWGSRLVSTDGCNWYQSRNGIKWDEPGIYSNDTLAAEYDNFSSKLGSEIIIARQRFEVGNENIDIDVTDVINKFVSGELKNYGIGIAFTPALERAGEAKNSLLGSVENYVGFFTNKTNTFFEPYVETTYNDYINDDRSNFVLNKKNRLYLYCNIGGKLENLDELPKCSIKNDYDEIIIEDLEVKQQFKGVYYVELSMKSKETDTDVMFYDVWSNIKYDGEELDDVELDFVTKTPHNWFNIDHTIHDEPDYTPSISGIDDSEDIYRKDEIRKVKVLARPSYTQNIGVVLDEMYYRLYVMDGERELTIIPYEHVNMTFNENFFYVDCDMLIPNKYYIDIRFKYNGEVKTFKDVLHFNIVSSLDNKYA